MKKLLSWIVLPPVALAMIAFAIANRGDVVVSLDPLPWAFAAPLYVVAMASVFVGLLAGAATAWTSGSKWRRMARNKRREAERLAAELGQRRNEAVVPATPVRGAATAIAPGDNA